MSFFSVTLTSAAFSQRSNISQLVSEVRIDSMMRTVNDLSGANQVIIQGNITTITSRYWNDPGNAQSQTYLVDRLQKYGWNVYTQSFGTKGLNIIARKQGKIWQGRKVIIGAHFDSMPNNVSPGADDNASGVAAVIEFARIIALKNIEFPVTIELVFWDEEEVGLLGSKAHVESLTAQDTIIAVINLDMLAWDGNSDGKTNIHTSTGGVNTTLAGMAIDALVYVSGLNANLVINGPYPSDHKPFLDYGFGAVGLTEDYQQDLNPAWHTIGDLASSFDLLYFQNCVRWAFALFIEVAWYQLPVSGSEPLVSARISPNPSDSEAKLFVVATKNINNVSIKAFDLNGKLLFNIFDGVLTDGFHVFSLQKSNESTMCIIRFESSEIKVKDAPVLKWMRVN